MKANIYVQENEPSKKDGIWLKMSNATAEHYISDDNIFTGGTWSLPYEIAVPLNYLSTNSNTVVGSIIYVFGGNDNTEDRSNLAYKYDTLTNIWTKLSDVPYHFCYGSAVAVGTDIYILGGTGRATPRRDNYKYDTLTDTYTKMTNVPYDFYCGSAVAIGTDIYIFGGQGDGRKAYKYDTLTNIWTRLSDISFSFAYGEIANVGDDIYLQVNTTLYKFNTTLQTYTQLTNTPITSYGEMVSCGTDLYLLSKNSRDGGIFYKYNTLNDTYTRLTNLPFSGGYLSGDAVIVGTDIYTFGSTNDYTRVYHIENKSYETDNTVVIAQGRTYGVGYNIKLFETNFEEDFQPLYGFADAYFYTEQDGLDGTMPVYYGNGTNWINIKNPPQNQGGAE